MTTAADEATGVLAEGPARPLVWSIRRELWENRSVYIAPVAVAAVVLFGFLISTIGMAHRRRATLLLDEAHQRAVIMKPFDGAAMILFFVGFVIAFFYCLDALHGERRDRSILFWKSLPVSDLTTVLSKASIPLAVLPAILFITIVMTQLVMLFWSSFVLLAGGVSPASTWKYFNLFRDSLILFYGLLVVALWYAPLYAWLILVSAWARRVAILWAVLPVFALAMLEHLAFDTSLVVFALKYRLTGGFQAAFAFHPNGTIDSLRDLTPGTFLATPGLWTGLAFAAVFLGIAVRLRRDREPI